MSAVTWLLDYAATNPEETIRYTKSDMILWTAADASYLSEKNARSRSGAVFFLSNDPNTKNKQMEGDSCSGLHHLRVPNPAGSLRPGGLPAPV